MSSTRTGGGTPTQSKGMTIYLPLSSVVEQSYPHVVYFLAVTKVKSVLADAYECIFFKLQFYIASISYLE